MEHSLEEKLAAIKMVEDGQSARSVSDKLKLGHHLLYEWLDIYRNEGVKGLQKKKRRGKKRITYEEKCRIVREYQENDVPLYQISARNGISLSALNDWLIKVEKGGFEALVEKKNEKRHTGMKKGKRHSKEEYEKENERLRQENERLRVENLLLKKVKALVEKREAQNKAIGRAPSTN